MPELIEDQIRAYDALLLGSCASPHAMRDLVALGRVLDLDLALDASAAGIWARLRPLVVGELATAR